ncbi:CmpA/NrtA family ABC transporter substrate-binding protein [Opitutales bacterium ASA1]|uniref:CmpA/NrtA family ABC transporter substrate-binding protein n=1 Tax=Congregicoccus parvus TaxID=3081749 RepID=UPI002B294EF6|nr:CmpA/NrtA family ABC transporter substrate-binding protein [Opitutales bacterium ASA1]
MQYRKKDPNRLRLGYVALTDAAPILVAAELGLFSRHGLQVELSREIGWATLRDKLLYGELDAAHALAGMLFSSALGIDAPAADVMTACVLNLHGNAVTISRNLWDAGVHDVAGLREEVRRLRGTRRLNFGVVYPFSFHHVQLREWLRTGGIDPDKDVRIVVVPPAQMYRNLAAGTIDGCCVGEPWNSVAVAHGAGCIVACSGKQYPHHMEKVLMVRTSFAESRAREHAALVSALIEACAWCDAPANRPALVDLLARPDRLGLAREVLAPALEGRFRLGGGRELVCDDFLVFHRHQANAPRHDRAQTLLHRFVQSGLLADDAAFDSSLLARLFREDLYASITRSHTSPALADA